MNRKYLIKAAFICVALILVLVILYSGLQVLESTVFYGQQEAGAAETKWIIRNGEYYYPRQDIVVVMLLGIDRTGEVTGDDADRGYAADMIALMIFDEQTRKSTMLCLNRDTMVMMPGLNANGMRDGTYYGQLALSHTFGNGRDDSCENVRETVSNMLNGIRIDYYIAMNMDAIAVLNDAVGGVEVVVEDDFSGVDPTLKEGIQVLTGQQAVTFVRGRRNVGDQLNVSRMERQMAYFDSFMDTFRAKGKEDVSFVLSVYDSVSRYIVTDCSGNVISSLMERFSDYELQEIVAPEGENVVGEEYMEFYVDEESLDALILRLFYAPK